MADIFVRVEPTWSAAMKSSAALRGNAKVPIEYSVVHCSNTTSGGTGSGFGPIQDTNIEVA
jgi:hypothetical protein